MELLQKNKAIRIFPDSGQHFDLGVIESCIECKIL